MLRTFSVYEMSSDSDDRERKGIFLRRFCRTVAPRTTQDSIFMHLTSSDSPDVLQAIDQCAATGYEMAIFSFGSGLNAEELSPRNVRKYRALTGYARSRGIGLGCYSLLASRWASDSVDVVNPAAGRRYRMDAGCTVRLTVRIPARGYTWCTMK